MMQHPRLGQGPLMFWAGSPPLDAYSILVLPADERSESGEAYQEKHTCGVVLTLGLTNSGQWSTQDRVRLISIPMTSPDSA